MGTRLDPLDLCHWMRESGLADLLPSLEETVYVGLSAGSMVMAPRAMGSRHAGPGYAIDDQTAIKVTDGTVDVASEGRYRLFTLGPDEAGGSG
jgi:dipeptidase E